MHASTIIVAAIIFVLTLLAWSNRFIQDDAFISFRYADNLVSGHGLVWNAGERIEGYTNFLWTLLMAVPLALKLDPVPVSFIVGLILFACSLIMTYRCANLICDSKWGCVVAVVLLGTNYTFSSFATGGLETQLQAFLFITCTYLVVRAWNENRWTPRILLTLSLCTSAAVLTRPEAVMLLVVLYPVTLYYVMNEKALRSKRLARVSILLLPSAAIIGSWVLWKIHYYGDILPNPYYVKVGSIHSWRRGTHYLYSFLVSYWLFPFPFIAVAMIRRITGKINNTIILFMLILTLWTFYLIGVSGGFMEYRHLVPVLPLIMLSVVWLIYNAIRNRTVQAVLVITVLAGSLFHALTFENSRIRWGITPISLLDAQIDAYDQDWDEVGRALGRVFDHSPDIMIATTASGAIPFYSRLRTVDMLGLNDRTVARQGEILSDRPGHQRIAPLSYLIDRNVDIVIGHPWIIVEDGESPSSRSYTVQDLDRLAVRNIQNLPTSAKFLEIPIDRYRTLVTLYLRERTQIENAIRENGWRVFPIARN